MALFYKEISSKGGFLCRDLLEKGAPSKKGRSLAGVRFSCRWRHCPSVEGVVSCHHCDLCWTSHDSGVRCSDLSFGGCPFPLPLPKQKRGMKPPNKGTLETRPGRVGCVWEGNLHGTCNKPSRPVGSLFQQKGVAIDQATKPRGPP